MDMGDDKNESAKSLMDFFKKFFKEHSSEEPKEMSSYQEELIKKAIEKFPKNEGYNWNPLPRWRPLDYQSVARKVFIVDELPGGALPIYDKDPFGFKCEKCGMTHEDKEHVHSLRECIAHQVMES